MYKIVRMFAGKAGYTDSSKRTIKTGLTLEEAQKHCQDPETSSSTCTLPKMKKMTRDKGFWFDGYERT